MIPSIHVFYDCDCGVLIEPWHILRLWIISQARYYICILILGDMNYTQLSEEISRLDIVDIVDFLKSFRSDFLPYVKIIQSLVRLTNVWWSNKLRRWLVLMIYDKMDYWEVNSYKSSLYILLRNKFPGLINMQIISK